MMEQYFLGPIPVGGGEGGSTKTLLSFKLNSTIVRHLHAAHSSGSATVQFLSSQIAKIVIGEVEYELQFAHINTTDCYEAAEYQSVERNPDAAVVMVHSGEVAARYQIMKASRLTVAGASVDTAPTTGDSDRCVKIIDGSAVANYDTLHASIKRSRGVIAVANCNSKPRLAVAKAKIDRSTAPAVSMPTPPPPIAARHTNTLILLDAVPIVASMQDVISSLLSGLSVSHFYLCELPSEVTDDIRVSVFVEFSSIDGAELGLRRSGESLLHRPIHTDEQSLSPTSLSLKHLTRSSISIHPATEMQAVWVRTAGWRLHPNAHSILSHVRLLRDFASQHQMLLMDNSGLMLDDPWRVAMELAMTSLKDRTLSAYSESAARVDVSQQDVRFCDGVVDRGTNHFIDVHRFDELLSLLDETAQGCPQLMSGIALTEDDHRDAKTSPYSTYRASLDRQHAQLSHSLTVAESEISRWSDVLARLLLLTHSDISINHPHQAVVEGPPRDEVASNSNVGKDNQLIMGEGGLVATVNHMSGAESIHVSSTYRRGWWMDRHHTKLLSAQSALAPVVVLRSICDRNSRKYDHHRFTQGSDHVDRLNPTVGTTALKAG